MKPLLAVLAGLSLTACANLETPLDDGYQLGDLTGSLLAAQAEYCATADPYRRAALAAVLRSQGIGLPSGGACTRLIELLPQPEADRIERAQDDQRRARQHQE